MAHRSRSRADVAELPPVTVERSTPDPMGPKARIMYAVLALLGAVSWAMIAIVRGEEVNAVWFVFAAVCSYLLAYRFYARYIEWKVLRPRDTRMTPAEEFENGRDFMPTDRRVLFGHHFAAIAGAGPLVGPVLAAQMGYLPGTIWIIVGVVLAGAVQDYMVLHMSLRRRGRSLGQMARDELGPVGGTAAILGVLAIMLILIAVLCIVVINAMAESPWAVFSIAMTIPIALFMGIYLRFLRPGAVTEVSVIGVVLLLAAIIAGGRVADSSWAETFTLTPQALAWWTIGYGFAAAVLPVWLLLAPRDYLSTFMKVGTIVMLAVGILVAAPVVQMPAVTEFASNGEGPAFAGSLFPFLFITIACGALSGFHALISSGTTPKLIEKESQARLIGYGSMLIESFVAIMALVAAISIDQHIYFAMNAAPPLTGGTAESAAEFVNGLGLTSPGGELLPPVDPATLSQAAQDVGEESIISRTGGAPTLAFGMAEVMSGALGGAGLKAFWYHFAVMFEALFILTTVDAGTRVARFMFSDALGNVPGLQKFKDPSWTTGAWIATLIVVGGWGSILIMGVNDPLGGIYTLFPLFGIANQLLAAIALTVVTAILVKQGMVRYAWIPGIPLVWDLIVTLAASWQKIFSDNPSIGYFAQNARFRQARDAGELLTPAKGTEEMDQVITNTMIQGVMSILFAVLVVIVVLAALAVCVKAVRAGGLPTSEEEDVPSRIFAPSGFIPTQAEKDVLAQWEEADLDPAPAAARHR